MYFLLFLLRMVSSYLVHHGYCATAEAFARSTDQTVLEELASIKNRQSKNTLVHDKYLFLNDKFGLLELLENLYFFIKNFLNILF